MDTFYEENQENNIKMLKTKMTLDFNSPTSHNKKSKFMKTCILESPDLKMLKLASPELERMIIAQNGLVTTTPTPSSILPYFLKQEQEVTEEQEQYARGFVDALNQLHQTNGHHQQQQQHSTNATNPSNNNNCLNSSQLNNTNNNSINNNNRNCIQNNNHLNSNQNQNTCPSSDSSTTDLTIAESVCQTINNNNNRRNSYHILAPVCTTGAPPPPVSTVANTGGHYNVNTSTTIANSNTCAKFAIPQIPSHEQYVSTCQTTGAQVLINTSVNSVLPPYSQAVNNNTMRDMRDMDDMSPPLALSPSPQSSLAPIDMADQERIKLERKRLRNRIAASKCRRRKLERISRLEDKVRGLKGENSELSIVVNKLRDQVCSLKQQVMNHIKCGCQLMAP